MAGEQVLGVSVVGGCYIRFMAGAQVWGVRALQDGWGGGRGLITLMAGERGFGRKLAGGCYMRRKSQSCTHMWFCCCISGCGGLT